MPDVSSRPDPAPAADQPSPLAVAWASTFGNLVFVFATIVCGLTATVAGWLPPRGNWMFHLAVLWARMVLWGSGVKVVVEYREELSAQQGYVFMPNHQSMYDIPVLLVTLPGQTRFLAKRSLFFIPFFGWGLWAGGFIPVDRRSRKSAQDTFKAAERTLSHGRSILIFPEETRSADGKLLPFKRGGMLLAQRTGFPIVPVGIEGAARVKPKGSWAVRPGTVLVRYGHAIDPQSFDLGSQTILIDKVRREVGELAGLAEGPAGKPPAAGAQQ